VEYLVASCGKTYHSCTIEHFMDGGNVLPIIMHCYKPSNKLMVYESSKFNHHKTHGYVFSTDVYSYNKDLDTVYLTLYKDKIEDVSGPKKCLFFEKQRCHYDVVNNKETI